MTKSTMVLSIVLLAIVTPPVFGTGMKFAEEKQDQTSITISDIEAVPSLRFEQSDRWRGVLRVTFHNWAAEIAYIPWVQVTFVRVTYVDGVAEEWGIKGNFTTNYAIGPNGETTFGPVRITEGGFDKQPKIIDYEIRYAILGVGENWASCQNDFCGMWVPEFLHVAVLSSMILLVALVLLRWRRDE